MRSRLFASATYLRSARFFLFRLIVIAITLIVITGPSAYRPNVLGETPSVGLRNDLTVSSLNAADSVQAQVAEIGSELPLSFEPNRGQANPRIQFLSRDGGRVILLSSSEVVLNAPSRENQSKVLRMRLVGSDPTAQAEGQQPLIGKSNYFIGRDPKRWIKEIPNFARVAFKNVYPDIDLAYYGARRGLEYDFTVAPGGDPGVIKFSFEGATGVRVDESGNLIVVAPEGEVYHHRPIFYQEVDGNKKVLSGRYLVNGRREVGFFVKAFDRSKPLVIDPVIDYSTYLGSGDQANAITVDSVGNAYITGQASSPDFPTTPGAYQTDFRGGGFVTKLNPTGTALVYSTYIGGVLLGYGIAVDSSGNAYITGKTNSRDLPTTPAALQSSIRGCSDASVIKLNASGTALVYSTYLGGGDSGHAGY